VVSQKSASVVSQMPVHILNNLFLIPIEPGSGTTVKLIDQEWRLFAVTVVKARVGLTLRRNQNAVSSADYARRRI
jgi:hypothetical protein